MSPRSSSILSAPSWAWCFLAAMISTTTSFFAVVDAEPSAMMLPDTSSCDAADFELPQTLADIYAAAENPPFLSIETFATVAALADGWTPGFAFSETPVVVRFVHLIDTMSWNCVAAYSSTWTTAHPKEDDPLVRAPSELSLDGGETIAFHSSPVRQLCMVHAWATVVNDWLPDAVPSLSGVIESFGYANVTYDYNPEVDAAFDLETGEADEEALAAIAAEHCYHPKIMGAIVARQVSEYGRRDGWNMYGELGRDGKPCRHNCRRYTDPTGYKPKINRNKFRWKPMLESDGRGYFTRQEHVTPHIGTLAKRAVLSDEDYEARVLKPTHDSGSVTAMYNEEAREVIRRLAETAVDDFKKAKIEFYDNKIAVTFAILGSLLPYGLSFEQIINFAVGVTAAEYDSVLVAWKVKVENDLVRPTTWIQEQMSDEEFETYAGPYLGVQTIRGIDFESYVRVMPHSEYISGSACLCHSLMEFTNSWMDLSYQDFQATVAFSVHTSGSSVVIPIATDDARGPPFLQGSSRTEPGMTPATNLTLVTESMTELRDQCSQSRLDGGMHFSRAVEDAYGLCDGIGVAAAGFSRDLLGEGGWADAMA